MPFQKYFPKTGLFNFLDDPEGTTGIEKYIGNAENSLRSKKGAMPSRSWYGRYYRHYRYNCISSIKYQSRRYTTDTFTLRIRSQIISPVFYASLIRKPSVRPYYYCTSDRTCREIMLCVAVPRMTVNAWRRKIRHKQYDEGLEGKTIPYKVLNPHCHAV